MMNMSKASIYDQLVSEDGEKFAPEAAQYAIDNLTGRLQRKCPQKDQKLSRTNGHVS